MEIEQRADGRLACPFDHHSPEYAERYADVLDELREKTPVAWSDNYGGFWIVTPHHLVRKLAMDSTNFVIAQGKDMKGGILIPPSPGSERRARFVPGEADGQEHDNYRMALNPMFSRQKVAELAPMIERHVNQTIDRILAQGEFDVIEELVGPILAGVACEHLGLEVEHPRAFFKRLFHLVSYTEATTAALTDVADQFNEAWAFLVRVVAERRANPRADVISHLTQWTDPVFTDEEVQSMTFNVILGAADTTGTLVSQAVLYMDQHPEVRALLSARPELIPAAIDEFLRLISPAMNVARTVVSDVEVEGVTLKAGDRILLSWYAANHDPARYPNPYAFDLERGATQHLGLGVGEHFCLGAWLAKAIAAAILRELLRRVPNYRIDIERAKKPIERSVLNKWETMPARTN
jgi:cytochrome P450